MVTCTLYFEIVYGKFTCQLKISDEFVIFVIMGLSIRFGSCLYRFIYVTKKSIAKYFLRGPFGQVLCLKIRDGGLSNQVVFSLDSNLRIGYTTTPSKQPPNTRYKTMNHCDSEEMFILKVSFREKKNST